MALNSPCIAKALAFREDRLKIKWRDYRDLLLLGGLIISADQYTKWLVRTNLDFMESWTPWPWLIPFARILHIHNTGAAFGMFQNLNLFFMILSIVVSILILYYYPQVPHADWPLRLAMIMQFGGAIGNLIDRIHQGYVTDFISVGSFAIFNIADASISMGVVVLIIGMLVKERIEKRAQLAQAARQNLPPAPVEPGSELGKAADTSHE
jgi:signal peptidase II